MRLVPWVELMVCWFAWAYPFIFRAPHFQKRASVTASKPSIVGLFLECLAIFTAFAFRLPPETGPGTARVAASLVFAVLAAVLSWTSVQHLGRQFRVRAGLYEDHELVRTGPYALVRHPIYASLLAALLCTLLLLTPWQWGRCRWRCSWQARKSASAPRTAFWPPVSTSALSEKRRLTLSTVGKSATCLEFQLLRSSPTG
jgi:protein-S-isoprenylcysteine O-methyltransferase Ste14